MTNDDYEAALRQRITDLRLRKGVSEHRMSLELGKSGSYIRGITSGAALPSARELFNIIDYLGLTPADFFAPLTSGQTAYARVCERLRMMDETDLEKVETFIKWIKKE